MSVESEEIFTPKQRGVFLINLGTPDAPEEAEVRRYLDEFLSDPRVIDKPSSTFGRWLLLNLFILPKRPKESAEAYRQIWEEKGSPLLTLSQDLVEKVQQRLGPDVPVKLGMRYQNPSIENVLKEFEEEGVDELVIFPLYPQYASASTGSTLQMVYELTAKQWNVPSIQVIPPFYDHPSFLDAFGEVAQPVIDDLKPDKVVMSFHGLPERHMTKSDASGGNHCLQSDNCCDRIVKANRNCYRAQCFATARGIAERLKLTPDDYIITFQSRLGKDPWVKPYTDEVIVELAKAGIEKIAILSPAFVADCLETLEELAMRAKEDFIEHGGKDLRLVPSLNATDRWADAVVDLIREHTGIS